MNVLILTTSHQLKLLGRLLSLLCSAPWESTTRAVILHRVPISHETSLLRRAQLTSRLERFLHEYRGQCITIGGSYWGPYIDMARIPHERIENELMVDEREWRSELIRLGLLSEEDTIHSIQPTLSRRWIFRMRDEKAVEKLRLVFGKQSWPVTFQQPPITFTLNSDAFHDGTRVQIVLKSPPKLNSSQFHIEEYRRHLTTVEFGQNVLYAPIAESTQTFLQDSYQLLNCWPDGLVHIADQQISGRGRNGNKWISPLGCLQFSLLLQYRAELSRMPLVQYLMALAIVKSIRRSHAFSGGVHVDLSALPLHIKWPNDIYADLSHDALPTDEKMRQGSLVKLGGILVNSSVFGSQYHVIIGVGLNLSNAEPGYALHPLLSRFGYDGLQPFFTREYVLASIMQEFETLYDTFNQFGFKPLLQDYYRYWLHSDQRVSVQVDGDVKVRACITGLTNDGYLLAQRLDQPDTILELQPDGNRFNMAEQLIVKKFAPRI